MIFWCRRCTEQSRSPRWIVAALRVGEDLDLDVARAADRALEQQARVAEGRARLRPRPTSSAAGELAGVAHQAHAAAAAAGRGLDHQRKADPRRLALQQARVLVRAVVARQHRHAGRGHAPARLGLVAHRPHRRRRRADPDQAGGGDRLGQVGVLAQEAVAGMHRRGARRRAAATMRVDAQVGVGGALAADRDRRVGGARVRRVPVGVGGDRDRFEAEPARRARDPRRRSRRGWRSGPNAASGLAPLRGRVCMYLAMMPSITSSAPPAIEPSRPSR